MERPGDRKALARARSLALHAQVADALERDERLLDGARARVVRWRAEGKLHDDYARAWLVVLDAGPREVLTVLRDPGERGASLRAVTPFTFVVSSRERARIWKRVAKAWADATR